MDMEVRAGQVYEDVKENKTKPRRLEVLSVELQTVKRGRLKAHYTYARVRAVPKSGHPRVIYIDTDRLRSNDYRLMFNPCPNTDEGTQDACAVGRINDASTPQDEP